MAKTIPARIHLTMPTAEKRSLERLVARLTKERGTEHTMSAVIREAVARMAKEQA